MNAGGSGKNKIQQSEIIRVLSALICCGFNNKKYARFVVDSTTVCC
jgi:hypothetical protein